MSGRCDQCSDVGSDMYCERCAIAYTFSYEKMRERVEGFERAALSLFDGLKHGDEEHRRWLKNFIINHFNDIMGDASPFVQKASEAEER